MPAATQTYMLPAGARACRADKALAAAFPEHSRAAFQRAFDAGRVRRGGRAIGKSAAVSPGDLLEFELPEAGPAGLEPADIPLDILYEDSHLLALNKPSGMVVHPGAGTGRDTLVHALLAHCGAGLSGIGGVRRPGIVHRLDRETSGAMLVAKTDAAHRGLAAQFAARTVRKEYLALVSGVPALLSGSIRKPIGRNVRQRHKMTVVDVERGGREAHTDWTVVERFGGDAALVRCSIHTGRTHQIRVHFKSAGHVLLGDSVYGWRQDPRQEARPGRTMLHAEHLVAEHPITGATLDLRAPLPPDFRRVLEALRRSHGGRGSGASG
jgi:23S rRNA pseudouridine1911/1915/1917 synthase